MQNTVQYSQQSPQGMNMNAPQQMSQHPQMQSTGDMINQLPADTSVPSHNEIRIVDQLFQQKKGIFDKILSQTKDIIVLGGLFILFSLPFVDNLLKKFITVTNTSPYILIGIKTLLFVLVYFIVKNIYLARKTTPTSLE